MRTKDSFSAEAALSKLKDGNTRYLSATHCGGDISLSLRVKTYAEGQSPYAVIITCSDSRVIPESIFDVGIGELFVIRVAGNVIDRHQLGSVEYAVSHLGCRLVVVMGHDHCGAVDAALNHDPEGYVKSITDEIKRAIGEEKDPDAACILNVKNSVRMIENELCKSDTNDVSVVGAIYRLRDGRVEWL